ncbi:MAG: hypothetical protein M1336_06665 [Deltaproteobacteria bacterium]|nr:hypothetical protein [Deltaproteobacteria bacterium]
MAERGRGKRRALQAGEKPLGRLAALAAHLAADEQSGAAVGHWLESPQLKALKARSRSVTGSLLGGTFRW